ncbi:MAG TPA: hypothetical protein VGQ87_01675 [Patescibacteria group bacterium]|jgi:FMN phosphatase YigB (HAD superfamily)|nr:hypothetical protein [Patescibacteria group bacterium]
MKGIKAILFDWDRTLYDKDNKQLFPETVEVLEYCLKKYKTLTIVSLAIDGDINGRVNDIEKFGLNKYFKEVLFDVFDKDLLYSTVLKKLSLKPEEVLVIDDRIKRLSWPIRHGCWTIWLKKGNFSDEMPDASTGLPNYKVESLGEIMKII